MTKEVIVTLRGVHNTEQEQGEPIETVSGGTYSYNDGIHEIQYEEIDEEDQQITKVTLRVDQDSVSMVKEGQLNTQMLFRQNQKTTSCYQTPYGDLVMGIDTECIEVQNTEECLEINMAYELDMNNHSFAKCAMYIKVIEK